MSAGPPLRDAFDDYLALRRALGFKLANAGRLLGQFVDYLDKHGVGIPTTDDALAWANLPSSASSNWRAIRLSVVRGFANYLHGLDASVEVPSAAPGRCPSPLRGAADPRWRYPPDSLKLRPRLGGAATARRDPPPLGGVSPPSARSPAQLRRRHRVGLVPHRC